MKKLFTQFVFRGKEKVEKSDLQAELQSAQSQVEWALRF